MVIGYLLLIPPWVWSCITKWIVKMLDKYVKE